MAIYLVEYKVQRVWALHLLEAVDTASEEELVELAAERLSTEIGVDKDIIEILNVRLFSI